MSPRVTAIVLAAGAGTRFGGAKLLARIDGRPVLQHVLDALVAGGIDDPVVVLGNDALALEAAIDWRVARRIRNPEPGRGLASSLHLGWAAAMGDPVRRPDAAIVALGDQPLLDPDVLRALVTAPLDPARPILVAHHADGARNPVRIEAAAADLVAAASGDRGLGPLLDSQPDRVRRLDVESRNPDIDRRGDLVAILEARWRARVEANAAQVERFREAPDGADFYATVSRTFVGDPGRSDDPVLAALLDLARPGDTWLDVGAGAGRYALPIARRVRAVMAVDPSNSMLDALRAAAFEHRIENVQALHGRWPPSAELRASLGPDPVAEVALVAHVGYDVAAIGPFVEALERAAARGCVAVLMHESPAAIAAPFWPIVHGEDREPLPALPALVELLEARGARPVVAHVRGERRRWADREELLALLRRQLWVVPGTGPDRRLAGAMTQLVGRDSDGSLTIRGTPPPDIGIVTWSGRESR
ncbi:MAG: NTP transferase domain-containing protein [Chloroflexi bacterium]|nr:NTP transferase domain-containing protein [Chloroflexota bacterium]